MTIVFKKIEKKPKNDIKFETICRNPKTNIYSVKNKNPDELLGFIKWFYDWEQYCFFPINSTIFSKGCMKDINDFISKIMEERKSSNKGDKKLEEDLHLI